MMITSETLHIFGVNLPLLYLFVFPGVFLWFFIFWREGKKDGFNEIKVFDLAFLIALLCGGLTYFFVRYFEWHSLYRPNNWLLVLSLELLTFFVCVVCSVLLTVVFAQIRNWSVYRILDIYVLSATFFSIPVAVGLYIVHGSREYLTLTLLLVGAYMLVLRFRGYRLTSGYAFTFFMIFLSAVLVFLFDRTGYPVFASVFFTMGMINFFMRRRIMMDKKSLPQDFLDKIKKTLLSKEKKLQQEELQLKEQDPYLQPGRANDNADVIDDAILEDQAKEQIDNKVQFIRSVRAQVAKALTAIGLGTYGKCEACGKSIDKARLSAYPEATLCLDCAEDAELADDSE